MANIITANKWECPECAEKQYIMVVSGTLVFVQCLSCGYDNSMNKKAKDLA